MTTVATMTANTIAEAAREEKKRMLAEYRCLLSKLSMTTADGKRVRKLAERLGRRPQDIGKDGAIFQQVAHFERAKAELPERRKVRETALETLKKFDAETERIAQARAQKKHKIKEASRKSAHRLNEAEGARDSIGGLIVTNRQLFYVDEEG